MFARMTSTGREQRQQQQGVALDDVYHARDGVSLNIFGRVPDRVGIELHGGDCPGAELGRRYREHRAASAEVGDAGIANGDALHESNDRACRRMIAGPERHAGIDDDRVRGVEALGEPGRRDAQRADRLRREQRSSTPPTSRCPPRGRQ